ncbi:MAG: helix-turn-helix transcriptional regulator [Clostridia bacterium]|nr:helix-turn-helix transcriptional regulator [Clostridia bacterium]
MENESIGSKIQVLRKARGITQADLGAYLNISYQAVSKWERDESCPDFATLSRIAQFFNVPITYFEDNHAETAATAVKPMETDGENGKLLGVCKDCGSVVYEGDEGLTTPVLVCKECVERRKRLAAAKEAAAKREKEKQAQEARYKAAAEKERISRRRGYGFILGGVLAGICVILGCTCFGQPDGVSAFFGWLILGLFSFTWGSQMFWDGFVFETTTFGGKIIGTPGVIFEFSLDGFIFLIAMKILFAVIRFLFYILSLLFFVVVAYLLSPFTFIPALIRVNSGDFE